MYPIKVRQFCSLAGAKLDNTHVIYVGLEGRYVKGSLLGNTFQVRIYGRVKALELYRIWLKEAIKAQYAEYRELLRILRLARDHEITLVCYCVDSDDPKDRIYCHAQIIRNALIYLDKLNIN